MTNSAAVFCSSLESKTVFLLNRINRIDRRRNRCMIGGKHTHVSVLKSE